MLVAVAFSLFVWLRNVSYNIDSLIIKEKLMTDVEATFSFGKNWEKFVEKHFNETRVEASKQRILDFLQIDSLKGKYFLDVGCGSGLSSLAAYKAGAERIVSFDVDPKSVSTTSHIREMHGSPDNWTVLSGSVLDKNFLQTLEPADLLYSWGVLHHTGSMWEAIENTLSLVKPSGVFYVALYTTTPESPFWIEKKKEYNRGGSLKKLTMEAWYIAGHVRVLISSRVNPIKRIFGYQGNRGMEYLTDVRDWLGGWPYEDATIEEVQEFFAQRDFEQLNITTGEANTEYLFQQRSG